jgi:hypothetical protein
MNIFISYRRSDTGPVVDLLCPLLAAEHRVFRDVDSIAPGADFFDAIAAAVPACDVALVMIGPGWLTDRLDDRSDIVRYEIAVALRSGRPVIPVLVDGVSMPDITRLPLNIALLTRRNAITVRTPHLTDDLPEALRAIRTASGSRPSAPHPTELTGTWVSAGGDALRQYDIHGDGTYELVGVLRAGTFSFESYEAGTVEVTGLEITFAAFRAETTREDPATPYENHRNRRAAATTSRFRWSLAGGALVLTAPGSRSVFHRP